ncbi:MAG TPA: pyruvate dehydrogenase complex dihydrolipoamide acetyltransferase [Saprospiraceae bacterium]|nr:pyruvate dehydrogenase complex dihydrolipoamide acetyltransferase [Saprospiraceae bacterium]
MAEVIRMPRLSDTMEEGVIVAWHKKVGDKVAPGDVLAEVETDKATMDLESFHDGYLLYIGVQKGAVPVDGVLAVIGKQGEDYKAALESLPVTGNGKKSPAASSSAQIPESEVTEKTSESAASGTAEERIKASPLAKTIARETGVDLSKIQGSGDQGRIVKRDVEGAASKKISSKPSVQPLTAGGYEDVALSQMRKTIARRLTESKFSAPHFYLTMEIDMSQAVEDRKRINNILDEATRISYNDLVIKACALTLLRHPKVNASWMENAIRMHKEIHIGVAVAVDDGLLVPVIRQTPLKTLTEIHTEVVDLAERARIKRLQPEEMQGNTFTVSNLGMFGIEEFTAIINPPDACILAVGAIVEKPVVRNSAITIAHLMKVTLSCDHRVVDGATGAQFLKTLKQLLENPVSMLA